MNIPSNITRAFGNFSLSVKQHAPTILTITGVVAGVAATATAIHATLRCDEALDRHQEKMRDIAKAKIAAENDPDILYSAEDEIRDKRVVYLQTALDFAKLYMPTVILTGLSITCILGAHNISSKRYAAVVAAFGALNERFEKYRENVISEFGKEKDDQFLHGINTAQETDPETGEPVESEPRRQTFKADNVMFFDEYSRYWDHYNPERNVGHLRAVMKWANDRMAIKGHVFINEIRSELGYDDTSSGAVMGYLYDEDNPEYEIDFGTGYSDDPFDYARDMPWDGKDGIMLTFDKAEIIYDKI